MYSRHSGIILIDAMLALAIATIFIAVISQLSLSARLSFSRAHDLSLLVATSSFIVDSQPYGNERIQEEYIATSSDAYLSYTHVHANNHPNYDQYAGTPLCTVDFFNKEIVGSYGWASNAHNVQVSITPISLPINPLLPLTDLQVRNGIAYVSTDSSNVSDPDILVIDIKDRAQARVFAAINTGPGIASIALVQNMIYGAAASTASQLHIIRLYSSDGLLSELKMSLESRFTLPLPLASTTPTRGSSIFYNNGRTYLGTEKWDGNEFNIIDVSDPAMPKYLGGFETGSKINDIFVRGGVAQVADSDELQLRNISVTNPTQPTLIDSFSSSGWNRQEGNVVNLFENKLGFGRTSGGFNIAHDHELFIFSTSTDDAPSNLSSIAYSRDIPGGIYGLVQDRSHVYIVTRDNDKEFQIFDRTLSTSTAKYYSLPVAPQRLTCDGDRLYILAATAPVIYEISFN